MTSHDYTMLDIVQRGSSSSIVRAIRKGDSSRFYIIKVMRKKRVAMHEGRSHHGHCAALEIRILSEMPHPHIIPLYEWFESKRHVYLVLKNGGMDLYEYSRKHFLSRYEKLEILCQVASALVWLHQHNIVYGDLKPENILVGPPAYLCDFGLSVDMGDAETVPTKGGTREFLPPESQRHLLTHRLSDVWSFGILMRELGGLEGPLVNQMLREDPGMPSESLNP